MRSGRRLPPLRGWIRRRIRIDYRALGVFRVSLALIIITDLILRSMDLVAHYTDQGVLPTSALAEQYPFFNSISLHAVSGSPWFQALLFLIAALTALALLVGYNTRIALLISVVLLASLHARNPLLLNAGDSLMRRLVFWGLFLPLGAWFSIDALRNNTDGDSFVGVASLALLVQVVLVYFMNGLFKLQGEMWLEGTAILYVYRVDQLTVLLGDLFAQNQALLFLLGRVWMVLLFSSIFLILLTGWRRVLLVLVFVVMHIGMLLTLRLGIFPLVSIVGLVPFLPEEFWDAVGDRFTEHELSAYMKNLLGIFSEILPRFPGFLSGVSDWVLNKVVPVVVSVVLVLILVWNAASLGVVDLPDTAVDPQERRWDMFAPEPLHTDGWYVVPGTLESGKEIDAFHGGSVEWGPPTESAAEFPSQRWFMYLFDLQRGREELHSYFASYLCREWNSTHSDGLVSVDVYYVQREVLLDGYGRTWNKSLGSYECAGLSSF